MVERTPATSLPTESFVGFLNAIPITGDSDQFMQSLKGALRTLFGDIDRISTNFNLFCDPLNAEIFTEHTMDTSMIRREGAGEESTIVVTRLNGERARSEEHTSELQSRFG